MGRRWNGSSDREHGGEEDRNYEQRSQRPLAAQIPVPDGAPPGTTTPPESDAAHSHFPTIQALGAAALRAEGPARPQGLASRRPAGPGAHVSPLRRGGEELAVRCRYSFDEHWFGGRNSLAMRNPLSLVPLVALGLGFSACSSAAVSGASTTTSTTVASTVTSSTGSTTTTLPPVIIGFSGHGSALSKPATAPASWQLEWHWTCSGHKRAFAVSEVPGAAGAKRKTLVSQVGFGGGGILPFHVSGPLTLKVNTNAVCTWKVNLRR
jgi:hypothetical protein